MKALLFVIFYSTLLIPIIPYGSCLPSSASNISTFKIGIIVDSNLYEYASRYLDFMSIITSYIETMLTDARFEQTTFKYSDTSPGCEAVAWGANMVLSVTSCRRALQLSSTLTAMQTLHVAISSNLCNNKVESMLKSNSSGTILLQPSTKDVAFMIKALLKEIQAEHLVVVRSPDSTIIPQYSEVIQSASSSLRVRYSVMMKKDIFDEQYMSSLLLSVKAIFEEKHAPSKYILLDINNQTEVEWLLKQASRQNMTNGDYFWLLTTPISNEDRLLQNIVNSSSKPNIAYFTTLQNCNDLLEEFNPKSTSTLNFEVLISNLKQCSQLNEVIISQILVNLLRQIRHGAGVLTNSCDNALFYKNGMKNESIFLNDLLRNVRQNFQNKIVLRSTHDQNNKTDFRIGATWFSNSTMVVNGDYVYLNEYEYFYNRTFRVVTLYFTPFIFGGIEVNKSDGYIYLQNSKGLIFEMLNELAQLFKFRYDLIKGPDGYYGAYDSKTGWNGMIKDLMDKRFDLSASAFYIKPSRAEAVDMSIGWLDAQLTVLLPTPEARSSLLRFFYPLHWKSWVCGLAAIGVIGISVGIFSKASPLSEYNLDKENGVSDEISIKENIWAMASIVLVQGQDFFPGAYSARFVLGCYWLFAVVILSSYTANLTSYLSITESGKKYTSFSDLANQDQIKLFINPTYVQFQEFKDAAPDSVYGKIFAKRSLIDPNTNDMMALAVQRNDLGILDDRWYLTYYQLSYCDKVYILANSIGMDSWGWAFQKHSYYTKPFNNAIQNMVEKGMIRNWIHKYWKPSAICSSSNDPTLSSSPIGLETAGGVFAILALFYGTAVITYLVEMGTARYMAYKKKLKMKSEFALIVTT